MSEHLSDPEVRLQSLSLELTALHKMMSELEDIQEGLGDPNREFASRAQLENFAAAASLDLGRHFNLEGDNTQQLIGDLRTKVLVEIEATKLKLADTN